MRTSRTIRVFRLMTAIQSGACSINDLVAVSGMSRRTVFRDLKVLQDVGVPVAYDARTRTYSVGDEFFFRPAAMSTEEAVAVLLALRKMCPTANLPYKNAMLSAAAKIECTLSPAVRRHCEAVLRRVSVLPHGHVPLLDVVFLRLQEAIVERRIVCLRYREAEDRGCIRVELRPLHLVYDDHKWHVLGRSGWDRTVRSFRLDRIEAVDPQGRLFLQEQGFAADEHLGNAWRIQPEGFLYTVRLRFGAEVAEDVRAVQWHHTQTTSPCEDGSVIMEFRVDGLSEILWWVLSYGDQVQVLEPAVLRERVRRIAMRTARAHDRTPTCAGK
ncbi:MAG TPA: WYL domain-containing transcriptional regulator [Phycisphaerales bacterium]|nr:WYL domain-containing transcriptional regulator [Phycisphaerales bacterium]